MKLYKPSWRPKRHWRTFRERSRWYHQLEQRGSVITHEPLSAIVKRAKAAIKKQKGTAEDNEGR